MQWIILFIVSYIIFFLFVDFKELKINIWCGVLAIILQSVIDSLAIHQGYYKIDNHILSFNGSSLFFIAGPVFVVSTLLAQFQPVKRGLIIINTLLLTVLYTAQELLLYYTGALIYTNWNILFSVQINILVISSLSWFSIVVLKKRVYNY